MAPNARSLTFAKAVKLVDVLTKLGVIRDGLSKKESAQLLMSALTKQKFNLVSLRQLAALNTACASMYVDGAENEQSSDE